MRRMLILCVLVFMTSACFVSAQEPPDNGSGRLHFEEVYPISGQTYFRLPGSATPGTPPYQVQGVVYSTPTVKRYNGSYRYGVVTIVGDAPAPDTGQVVDWYLRDDATSQQTQVTRFRGAYYMPYGIWSLKWSNDNQDSFLSFGVRDTTVTPHVTHLVRTKVSLIPNAGLTLTAPGFVPFDDSDLDPLNANARLEVVVTFPDITGSRSPIITPDGSTVIYLDFVTENGERKTLLKSHAVGSPVPVAQDPVIFDQRVTGIRPGGLSDITPDGTKLYFRGESRRVSKTGTVSYGYPSGIIELNLSNGDWIWRLPDTSTRSSGRDRQERPKLAPDGSAMIFTGYRLTSNGRWAGRAIWRLNLATGRVDLVYENVDAYDYYLYRWTY